jgi:4-amino-4-deoxy-L-arabinose transferase-like glycosyltransferase
MSSADAGFRSPGQADSSESAAASGFSRRTFFVILTVYFLLHVLIRVLLSPSTDLDESEQIVYGQELLLGYGPAPPLYTWLQLPFFAVFGQGVLALSLLKGVLLCFTCLFTNLNGR